MSDILLTSSKSSLPGSSESATAAVAVSPRSRRSDSARGDSIDSWPSEEHRSTGCGGGGPPQRSCSLGDVAAAHGGGPSVPDSELQRQARRHGRGGVSMDPGAGEHHRRRRTEATGSSSGVEQRRRRRHSGEQKAAGRRAHKSRSLTQMTTVDEEQATAAAASTSAASRLDAPAFTGSAV